VKQYLPYYKHLRVVKLPFALGVLAGLVYALASGVGFPLMVKVVFPVLFNEDPDRVAWYLDWLTGLLGTMSPERLLLITCLWIPVVAILRSASGYASAYLIQFAGTRVLEEIRTDLFVKLQSLPLSFFKNNRSGDLLARLMGDTLILRQIVANVASDLVKQPATLLGAVGFLIWEAWRRQEEMIWLIPLLTVPLCVMVIRIAGKKLAARAKSLQRQSGDMTAHLSESLQAPLEIRAYNLEGRQIELFRQRIRRMLSLSMKVVKYRQAISPSIEAVAAIGLTAALYLGVSRGMSQTDFMAVFTALFMAYEPLKKLGAIHSHFKQADAAIERIRFISDQPDSLPDPVAPQPFHAPRRAIRIDRVSFAYKDEPVLSEISLHIPIGQVVALVGPSGAGKSTFANLIPRFYDPVAGSISFDDIDVRQFTKEDLRNAIAVVPQMPSLFMGTIADNIRIGRRDASDEEVIAAAKKANAHPFILSLPGGYQTDVGERGDLLSGGQRQRIAIARAFLKDAPILILDEATSALDSESESMVQQALGALVKGRTTFIIAHRFSTITIADRVLVFKAGRIVADGSHESLRETDPTYRAMLGSQLGLDAPVSPT
jgi:ATP-binding cassette, subfamily B, bacterial MsbA